MAFRVPVIHLAMPPSKPLRQPEIALIKDCKQLAMLLQMFDRHEKMAPMATFARPRFSVAKRQKAGVPCCAVQPVRTVYLSICQEPYSKSLMNYPRQLHIGLGHY